MYSKIVALLICVSLCGCEIRARPKQLTDKSNPAPVVTGELNTALLSEYIARQVELANADPGRRETSSAVAQSITRFGKESGIPADYIDRLVTQVPVISKSPAVQMTDADIAAIRKVR